MRPPSPGPGAACGDRTTDGRREDEKFAVDRDTGAPDKEINGERGTDFSGFDGGMSSGRKVDNDRSGRFSTAVNDMKIKMGPEYSRTEQE